MQCYSFLGIERRLILFLTVERGEIFGEFFPSVDASNLALTTDPAAAAAAAAWFKNFNLDFRL